MKKFAIGFAASAAVMSAVLMSGAALAAVEGDDAYQAIAQGHWRDAEAMLRQGLAQNPNDAAKLLDLAFVLRNTGRQTEAISVYQRVLRLGGDPAVTVDDAAPSTKSADAKRVAKNGIASLEWAKR